MLGDVGQPHVGHGRAGSALAPPAPDRYRDEVLCPVEAMDTVLRRDPAGRIHLVGQQPVAERRVVRMCIDETVRQMRIIPVPLVHRISEPPVLGLA